VLVRETVILAVSLALLPLVLHADERFQTRSDSGPLSIGLPRSAQAEQHDAALLLKGSIVTANSGVARRPCPYPGDL
jgi:hypothetical protein